MNDDQTHGAASYADSSRLIDHVIVAETAGDLDAELDFLRRSVSTPNPGPLALHLAAAEFAQRGETGSAIVHFTQALERAPTMHVARLQLALLWLIQRSPATAAATLQPLLSEDPASAFAYFATALEALTRQEAGTAAEAIDRGLAMGCDNEALLNDMCTLRSRLDAGRSVEGADAHLATMRHGLAVGAYTSSEDPES